jgi:hypothetical protein
MTDGGYKLPHGQGDSTETLDGRPGDQVQLQGVGSGYYEWSPKTRRALDLELRARLVETSCTIGETPLVRFNLEVGHGVQSWNLPQGPLPIVSGTLVEQPILPGRGLLLRLSARRLRINFFGGFTIAGAPVTSSKIAVSVQPAIGERCCNADWYTQLADPGALPPPPHQQPFPMGAREFRLRNALTGVPFPAAACVVIYAGVAGGLFGPVDVFAGGLNDWTPIPVHAVSLLTSVLAMVSYR